MKIYGLTGQTGAGKSTVAASLSKKGFFVIDGDKVARRVTEKGSPALAELSEAFGKDILLPDGTLDRKKLAERAFASKEGTKKLNELTHPHIHALFIEEIEKAKKSGFSLCLIDAAALLESPSKALCEKIIVVFCPEDIRLERITKRDNITKEAALRRIHAQKSDEYYLSNADIIIKNYPPYDLEKEIEKFLKGESM